MTKTRKLLLSFLCTAFFSNALQLMDSKKRDIVENPYDHHLNPVFYLKVDI